MHYSSLFSVLIGPAFVGKRNEIYEDKCEGVDVICRLWRSGTIVESREDIHAIAIVMPTFILDMEYFNSRILKLLQSARPDAYRDMRLCGGKKISGASFVEVNC